MRTFATATVAIATGIALTGCTGGVNPAGETLMDTAPKALSSPVAAPEGYRAAVPQPCSVQVRDAVLSAVAPLDITWGWVDPAVRPFGVEKFAGLYHGDRNHISLSVSTDCQYTAQVALHEYGHALQDVHNLEYPEITGAVSTREAVADCFSFTMVDRMDAGATYAAYLDSLSDCDGDLYRYTSELVTHAT